MVVAWKVTSEGGVVAGIFGKVLPGGSSGGTLVWSGYMGVYGDNNAAVIVSACEFPAVGHT